MASEYIATGHFSIKSDIFSFGVILLEIVSGLKNRNTDPATNQKENLLSYVSSISLILINNCLVLLNFY